MRASISLKPVRKAAKKLVPRIIRDKVKARRIRLLETEIKKLEGRLARRTAKRVRYVQHIKETTPHGPRQSIVVKGSLRDKPRTIVPADYVEHSVGVFDTAVVRKLSSVSLREEKAKARLEALRIELAILKKEVGIGRIEP